MYHRDGALQLTGALTLDAQGDPDAVFIFQIDSGLVTAPGSSILITNGGQSCNVYWKVGESAIIDTSTTFVGTIMALTSISLDTGATVEGRALARNGSVTLNNNTFTQGVCTTSTPSTSTSPSTSSSAIVTPPIVASSSGASTPPPTEGRVSSPPIAPATSGSGLTDTSSSGSHNGTLALGAATLATGIGLAVVGLLVRPHDQKRKSQH